MDRRTFLVTGVAALGLAGCTNDAPEPPAPTGSPIPTEPDDLDSALRTAVARSEAELIIAYRTAISSRPELADDLEPFLAHHEEHLDRVLPGVDPRALVTPSAGASDPGSAASGSATAAEPTATAPEPEEEEEEAAEAALARLAAAERTARVARVSACDGASSAALARDLCQIAASEAQHAAALDALAKEVVNR